MQLGSKSQITGKDGRYSVSIDGDKAMVQVKAAGSLTCTCGKQNCLHMQLVRDCGFEPRPDDNASEGTANNILLTVAPERVICQAVANLMTRLYCEGCRESWMETAIALHRRSGQTEFVSPAVLDLSAEDWEAALYIPEIDLAKVVNAANEEEAERIAFVEARALVAVWITEHQHRMKRI